MTSSMQDSVGGAISLALGLALLFWLIPGFVESDPDLRLPVNLLPRIVAFGFVACGLLMVLRGGFALRRGGGVETGGFEAGEFGKFCLMILLLLGSTMAFSLVHFLVVAPILVGVGMWIFAPIRPVSFLLTVTLGPAIIWVLSTQVLGRVLP